MTQIPFNLFVSLKLKSCSTSKEHALSPSWDRVQLFPHLEIRSIYLAMKLITTRQTVYQQLYQNTWLYLIPTAPGPQAYLLA